MTYKKMIETKIIRCRHEVSFRDGARAIDILNSLRQVPSNARLVEVITPDCPDDINVMDFVSETDES